MKSKNVYAAVLCAALLAIPACAQVSFPGTTGPIPPTGTSGTSIFTATVSGSGTITDLTVPMNLNHTFMGDLDIILESPGGTSVQLWDSDCGSSDNLNGVFVDGGSPAGTVCGPTGGNIGPAIGALADFAGEDANGDWTLTITDSFGGDSGQMNAWSLEITADGGAPETPASSTTMLLLTGILLMGAGAFFLTRLR